MKTLKSIGHAVVFVMWLLNVVILRGIVAAEAFTFLVLMPFMKHIGLTFGEHVTLVYWHRLTFMLAVPALTVLLSLGLSYMRLFSNRRLFAGLSVAATFAFIMWMAHAWPDSVHVEAIYALYASVFMTAVCFFTNWLFKNSALAKPPERPTSNQSQS